MTNSMSEYVTNFRANKPSGITYDSTIDRYFYNGKRFVSEWEVESYRNYLLKTTALSAIPATAIQERDGDYILDRSGNYIEVRAA